MGTLSSAAVPREKGSQKPALHPPPWKFLVHLSGSVVGTSKGSAD